MISRDLRKENGDGSISNYSLLTPLESLFTFCGPSGIRTHGLLNAIEARSQLRYGPKAPCGPGGIRTLDLLSAIEARSQLRYRPSLQGKKIVPEGQWDVKEDGFQEKISRVLRWTLIRSGILEPASGSGLPYRSPKIVKDTTHFHLTAGYNITGEFIPISRGELIQIQTQLLG